MPGEGGRGEWFKANQTRFINFLCKKFQMTTPVALLTLVIWVVLTAALMQAAKTNRAHVVLAQVIKNKK